MNSADPMTLNALGNKPIILRDNRTCPYCLKELVPDNFNDEHVVGRRFVQKGSLDGSWNLILRACKACNAEKAALEDDLSAISMHPTAAGVPPRPDETFVADARRKAEGSTSQRTGKPVIASHETFTVDMSPQQGIRVTAQLTTQPQADPERIFELAWFHVAAFFYYVTYNTAQHTGAALPVFFPLVYSFHADWGNPVHRAFMDAVVRWEPRMFGNAAKGLFRIAIRRHPQAVCWSWALEWNASVRVIGFFGESDLIETAAREFPKLRVDLIPQPDGSRIGVRSEVALLPADDRLFDWRDENGNDYQV